MSQHMDSYIAAKKEMIAAESDANRIVASFVKITSPLNDWKKCELNAHGYFSHHTKNPIRTAELPTIEQLTNTINSWHEAKAKADLALLNVPQDERQALGI